MIDDGIPIQLGRVEGRLGALEDRVDRHELFVGTKLTSIEGKLDIALTAQTKGATIGSLFRWAVMIATGASGWFALVWTGRHQ